MQLDRPDLCRRYKAAVAELAVLKPDNYGGEHYRSPRIDEVLAKIPTNALSGFVGAIENNLMLTRKRISGA